MSLGNTPLLQAMGARMDYLYKRQEVLAQNIANADTPGYQPKDLTKVDFASVLDSVSQADQTGALGKITLARPRSGHTEASSTTAQSKERAQKLTYEVAPDGNSVILEEQMIKVNQTQMEYTMLASLRSKYSAMYKLALGRQN